MPEKRLQTLIQRMNAVKILVMGDIMLDRFVYGHVERISPESPVPVLSIKREERMLGGAGNALANLAGLGAKARMMALIGQDPEGREIEAQIKTLGFDTSGLITDENRPTIVKTRFLAGHQQLLRTDFERNDPLDDLLHPKTLTVLDTQIKGVQAVILSDYGKGFLTPALISAVMTRARALNIPVIVDPKGHDFTRYRGANVITPNRKELSEATKGAPTRTDAEICLAAGTILDTCGIEAVVATRSGDGMSVITKGADPVHIRSSDIEVFDVSGAGDTVIATLSAALAAGGTLVEAATLANLAGSLVVTKVGTAPIHAHELTHALEGDSADILAQAGREREKGDRMRRGDIMALGEAAEHVRRWHARGLRVGFTNGCFDVLHYGHVSYLNQARDHCDRLIVGLNTDMSVQILKGPDRPVHDERARAGVLAALGAVDMVVLFGAESPTGDNTAKALLSTLKPDVYFKGGDYIESQIPEAPTVKSYGGVVKIMPVYEGHSTTASIRKIKA